MIFVLLYLPYFYNCVIKNRMFMKKFLIPVVLSCLLLISCSSNNQYEKLISDYVQTDKHGTWTDLQFKVVELKELTPFTVSDSIAILKQAFEDDNKAFIGRLETLLNMSSQNLKREESSRFKSKIIIDTYQTTISKLNHSIDSVKQLQFVSKYEGTNPDKILLQPVECKYSYVFPASSPKQERTDIFYFLPDHSKIIAKKQVK